MLRGCSWFCFLRSAQSCLPADSTWGENGFGFVFFVRLNCCSLSSHLLISRLVKLLLQVFLKSDNLCLTREEKMGKKRPTLPSVHILAMHVQQLEIGAFTLATGAYKWNKLRWEAAWNPGRCAWSCCWPGSSQLWWTHIILVIKRKNHYWLHLSVCWNLLHNLGFLLAQNSVLL